MDWAAGQQDKEVSFTLPAKPGGRIDDELSALEMVTPIMSLYELGPGTGRTAVANQESSQRLPLAIASRGPHAGEDHKTDYPDGGTSNPTRSCRAPGSTGTSRVTNNGPDNSVGPFVVTDTLPVGTEYKSYSGSGLDAPIRIRWTSRRSPAHPDVAERPGQGRVAAPLTLVVKVGRGRH